MNQPMTPRQIVFNRALWKLSEMLDEIRNVPFVGDPKTGLAEYYENWRPTPAPTRTKRVKVAPVATIPA